MLAPRAGAIAEHRIVVVDPAAEHVQVVRVPVGRLDFDRPNDSEHRLRLDRLLDAGDGGVVAQCERLKPACAE
jgi:hypothetical protein